MEPGAATISFALEAVEHLIYETTSVVRRRLLHGRAGAALSERAWDSSDGRLVTSVARHLHMSGAEDEAADWYFRAGDLSFAAYAHTEAENSYQMAQALGHPEAGQIRLSLANLYLLTGRYQKALGEFDTVAATSSGEEAARAEHGVGEVHRRLGRFELAVHHFERAEPDHPEPALLYADWGMLALRAGDTDEAMRRAKQSLAEAEAAGDDELVARAHHLLGVVTPDAAAAPAHFERALELAEDMGQRMASLNGLARAMGREGNFASALPVAEEALRLAETIGDRHRQAALLNHLADIHQRLGDTARAEELVTQSVRLFAELEPDAWEPEIWLLTGW
jgi:tetratricopeptide (TPR) repeat protein